MLKFLCKSNDGSKTIIGIGISAENVEHLRQSPQNFLFVQLAQLGLRVIDADNKVSAAEVTIVYGKTEMQLLGFLKANGLLDPETLVNIGGEGELKQ